MATLLWLCFKLSSCLFGNTRDTSLMHEKAKCVCYVFCVCYATEKGEIQICSNKHETGLVESDLYPSFYLYSTSKNVGCSGN